MNRLKADDNGNWYCTCSCTHPAEPVTPEERAIVLAIVKATGCSWYDALREFHWAQFRAGMELELKEAKHDAV